MESSGAWEKALQNYTEMIAMIPKKHPKFVELQKQLRRRIAMAYLHCNEIEKAIVELQDYLAWATQSSKDKEKTLEYYENIGEAFFALADCLERKDDLKGASENLRGYLAEDKQCNLENDPKLNDLRQKATVKLGSLLNRMGQTEEAIQYLGEQGDDASCIQLGMAKAMAAWPDFLKVINESPQATMKFLEDIAMSNSTSNTSFTLPPNI
jgi:tetratricopeptide (TPR) repeat protein